MNIDKILSDISDLLPDNCELDDVKWRPDETMMQTRIYGYGGQRYDHPPFADIIPIPKSTKAKVVKYLKNNNLEYEFSSDYEGYPTVRVWEAEEDEFDLDEDLPNSSWTKFYNNDLERTYYIYKDENGNELGGYYFVDNDGDGYFRAYLKNSRRSKNFKSSEEASDWVEKHVARKEIPESRKKKNVAGYFSTLFPGDPEKNVEFFNRVNTPNTSTVDNGEAIGEDFVPFKYSIDELYDLVDDMKIGDTVTFKTMKGKELTVVRKGFKNTITDFECLDLDNVLWSTQQIKGLVKDSMIYCDMDPIFNFKRNTDECVMSTQGMDEDMNNENAAQAIYSMLHDIEEDSFLCKVTENMDGEIIIDSPKERDLTVREVEALEEFAANHDCMMYLNEGEVVIIPNTVEECFNPSTMIEALEELDRQGFRNGNYQELRVMFEDVNDTLSTEDRKTLQHLVNSTPNDKVSDVVGTWLKGKEAEKDEHIHEDIQQSSYTKLADSVVKFLKLMKDTNQELSKDIIYDSWEDWIWDIESGGIASGSFPAFESADILLNEFKGLYELCTDYSLKGHDEPEIWSIMDCYEDMNEKCQIANADYLSQPGLED